MRFSITHKISTLAILLVLLTAAVIGSAFYIHGRELLVQHALRDISEKVEEERYKLQEHIETQRQDTLFLAQLPAITNLVRHQLGGAGTTAGISAEQELKDGIADLFVSLIRTKPRYIQLRYIDAGGMELVRVNREGEKVMRVPGQALQDKSARPYVYHGLRMPAGQSYASEINLNREYGTIVTPPQEVFRTVVPVYLQDHNKPSGVVVINSEIGHELRSIQHEVESLGNEVYITNDHGGYLVHPDRSKVYGQDLGHYYRIQEEFPLSADLFVPGNRDKGLVLLPEQSLTNQVVVFTKLFFDANRPERFLMVAIAQNYDAIVSEQVRLISGLAGWAVMTVLVAIILALLFSRRLTLPLQLITGMVNAFPRVDSTSRRLPFDQQDEIGVLARAFASMSAQVSSYQDSLKRVNEELEHKVAERTAELQSVAGRYQNIVENMVDGLITIDTQGVILSFNRLAENIFGYQEDEVIGSKINLLMPEPYHSAHDEYIRHYLATGEKKVIGIGREVEGRRKDGSVFPIDLAISELHIEGERVFSGIVRDITERKRIEKMKNEFISTVSHELRTPLTSIRGSLGLICGGAVGEIPEQASEMLKIANNNTERLLLLINDILDVQKIESGQMVFKCRCISVLSLLKQAIEENQAYGTQYGIRYELAPHCEDMHVYADRNRLLQVMSNLLSNAAKFSPAGEVVEVGVEQLQGLVRVSVSDHGPGIAPEFQAALFDRFTQCDSSDTRAKGGTGLGLNIAKAIVEKHGGYIGFESTPDVGTRFYFELPLMHREMVEKGDSAQSDPLAHAPARVLIVEDDMDIATLLKKTLAEEGLAADIACDAEQAREMLRTDARRYCAMTLDLMLPGESGLSFLSRIRRTPATRNLPVIIISAGAEVAREQLLGGAMHMVDWLSKPIDPQRLLESIRGVLPAAPSPRILHVEDDEDLHRVVQQLLQGQCEVVWAADIQASRQALREQSFDLVLLDLELADGSGFELLELIEQCLQPPRVIVFSAHELDRGYADRVSAVLTKSRTDNAGLKRVIMSVMRQH